MTFERHKFRPEGLSRSEIEDPMVLLEVRWTQVTPAG